MSKRLSRRGLLRGAAGASAALLIPRRATAYATVRESAAVNADIEIGKINPYLHGHFAEHLGTCIYEGLWVGKNSPVPNVEGFRRDAIEHLSRLGIPVLRWPGGCFADDYHWRDGIGPTGDRPSRVNIHWGNYTEDNSFGTHEFVGLCRKIGAEPYIAGNLGSGTPQEMRDWVEYCNYPGGSTLSDERAANGSKDPFGVVYWGVGNENWGCGGNMTPQEYASHYRRFVTYMRTFGGTRPYLIACGPSSNDPSWTRGFFTKLYERQRRVRIDGYAMHFYSWGGDSSTKFTVENMREQLSSFAGLEEAILQQRAIMDGFDPERRIGLLIDEWGVWDRLVPEEEKQYGRLWQQNTIRSALAAALGLNVFHRQAEKLHMCNIAQTVNVLQALLLTDRDRCVVTPTYYAYELEKPHRDGMSLRTERTGDSPLGVSISASRKDNKLAITLVNPKHNTNLELSVSVRGAKLDGGTARILHHADRNACNTFDAPSEVTPADHSVEAAGSMVKVELPPLSIVTAVLEIA